MLQKVCIGDLDWNGSQVDEERGKVVCRLHRDDDSENQTK